MTKLIIIMNTTFEKLSQQEMVNVTGGDTLIKITDKDGNVFWILIEDGLPERP